MKGPSLIPKRNSCNAKPPQHKKQLKRISSVGRYDDPKTLQALALVIIKIQ